MPSNEKLIIGEDLNAHIGRVHGGWGMGERNKDGERVLNYTQSFNLVIYNTFFKKSESQYATFKGGDNESQIDFFVCIDKNLNGVKNCKVIFLEYVAKQHKGVVLDWGFELEKKKGSARMELVIKWWRLKSEEPGSEFENKVMERVQQMGDNAHEWQTMNSEELRRMGEEVLGLTSGMGPLHIRSPGGGGKNNRP